MRGPTKAFSLRQQNEVAPERPSKSLDSGSSLPVASFSHFCPGETEDGRPSNAFGKGRRARYCRPSCKQRAYESRGNERPQDVLARDINTVRVLTAIRTIVLNVLEEYGVPMTRLPEPKPSKKHKASKLAIVKTKPDPYKLT